MSGGLGRMGSLWRLDLGRLLPLDRPAVIGAGRLGTDAVVVGVVELLDHLAIPGQADVVPLDLGAIGAGTVEMDPFITEVDDGQPLNGVEVASDLQTDANGA